MPTKLPTHENPVKDGHLTPLHKLCRQCAILSKTVIREFDNPSEDEQYQRFRPIYHCSFAQLRASYFKGCHICALIWYYVNSMSKSEYNEETIIHVSLAMCDPETRTWMQTCGVIAVCMEDITCKLDFVVDKNTKHNSHAYLRPDTAVPVTSLSPLLLPWIESRYRKCLGHQNCQTVINRSPSGRPSRLLDVRTNKIRLCDDTSAIKDPQYVTLSHMWNDSLHHTLKLSRQTLESFKIDIPVSQISPIFLDAIQITRALGFWHIWIDALCIVQDSEKDWEREGRKMAAVYGRSACNICFSTPLSTRFAVARREPLSLTPCRIGSGFDGSTSGFILPPHTGLYDGKPQPQDIWGLPLFTRGWVFQEYLLCPRIIHYGQKELAWECLESHESEFPVISDTINADSLFDIDVKTAFHRSQILASGPSLSPSLNPQELGDLWCEILSRYGNTCLTYERDRVMAIAGIAESIQKRFGYTYLGGSWKELFVPFLLWYRGPEGKAQLLFQACDKTGNGTYDIPTWSWFSFASSHNIHHLNLGIVSMALRFYCRPSYEERVLFKADLVGYKSSYHGQPESSLLFYRFDGLDVQLRTSAMPGKLRKVGSKIHIRLGNIPDGEWEAGDPGLESAPVRPFSGWSSDTHGDLPDPTNFYSHDYLIQEGEVISVNFICLLQLLWDSALSTRNEILTVGLTVISSPEGKCKRCGIFYMKRFDQAQSVLSFTPNNPYHEHVNSYWRSSPFDSLQQQRQEIWLR
ncbi:HET-domain-containing protein [Xylariaceae sp. FL1651]|nr:HET-domain-containing protein [Xylariaceae sp. FL1651]